ncbi:MAG: type II toxin-antitoxin system VapC family toxin [Caldilineaceae bacterium]|nr:type II toxin-antitoxin system VapC family toxin [Caldilineaceae bacterium]MCB0082935.1 type II toxin-antitoxin system VapC family toxin [Caldilineaceae bacterium]
MYLLDTDTLTHLYAGEERVLERLRRLQTGAVGTTIINKVEILRGRSDAVRKAANGEQLLRAQTHFVQSEALLEELPILLFDAKAGEIFDMLRQASGMRKIGHADLMIASLALAHRSILVTRNLRHFRPIPRLQVENWVD